MNGKKSKVRFITTVIVFKLLLISNFLFSQKLTIQGKILDTSEKPIQQISIQLYKNDSLKDYTFSNDQGNYLFKVTNGKYVLKTSSMLYESITKNIEIINSSKIINFQLNEKNTILEEVVLKIERDIEIRKDTIIFKASAFENKRQVVLEDLLKDIPGIQISDNGNIMFQGKLVTNVKIENDDLFNGGYKILTKNLKADLVNKIQVLQNYSDNPILKNVRDTEDVAINITLKEDRKSTLFGDIDIFSNLKNRNDYHTNLISFLKKTKLYFIADYNNIGKDSYLDFKNIFTSKSDNPTLKIGNNQNATIFTTLNTIRPNLDDEYVNLNDAQLYNLSSIYKLNPRLKVKTVLLAYENETFFLRDQNTIFNADPIIIIDENSSIEQKEKLFSVKIDLDWNINKSTLLEYDAYYSLFSLNGNSAITLPTNSVDETTLVNGERTNHFLNFSKKLKDSSVIQVTTRYIFDNKPQNYSINPFPYENTFGDDFDMVQSETVNKLSYFIAQFSYLKDFGSHNIESYLGYHNKSEDLISLLLFRKEDSEIFSIPQNFTNNLFFKQQLYYIKTRYRKNIGDLNVSLNIDLNLEDNKRSNFTTNNFVYFNSIINFKYQILNKHEFNFTSSINQFTNPLSNLNTSSIPLNYRNFSKGLLHNTLQEYYNLNVNYIYGNWNDKFTGGFNFKYSYGDKYLSFNSLINEEITEIEKIILNGKKDIQIGFYFDRYLNFISSNLKFKSNYLDSKYANSVNNDLRTITFNSFSNEIELRSNFSSFFDYHLGYSLTNLSTKIENQNIAIINKKGFIDFDFYFKKIVINVENDLYFFDEKSAIENYFFSNIKGNYKVNSNLSAHLKVHNLLNNKTFDIFSQTDFFQFTSQTPLLERYILLGFNYRF